MKKKSTLILLVTLLVLAFSVPLSAASFTDVKDNDWFAPFVYDLSDQNILSGYPDSTFRPQNTVTRGEFVKILAFASKDDLSGYGKNLPFTDSQNHWSKANIDWAYQNGIVNGKGEKTFDPDGKITRQEMAVMIYRYADYMDWVIPVKKGKINFADANGIASWALDAVTAMQQGDIISGYPDKTFKPNNPANRGEASKMISTFLKSKEKAMYLVTFESNGGNIVTSQLVKNGSLVVKPKDPKKDNYVFLGWFSDENLKHLYDFSTPVSADITLYAGWTKQEPKPVPDPKKYSVKFESNGGTSVSGCTVADGDVIEKPVDPKKEKYLFGGWYSDPELTVLYDFTLPVTKDITLYAAWDEDNDGDKVSSLLEETLGANDASGDSDGDGIDDYDEIFVVGSSPAENDGGEDYDYDGLSNDDEVNTYGTDPKKADTDSDGLSDFDEVRIHITDPLNPDSDGDALLDGDEVSINSDPREFTDISLKTQTLSESNYDASLLAEENEVIPSVTGTSASVLDRIVFVKECRDDSIIENPAVIGNAITLEVSGDADLTLGFSLDAPKESYSVMMLDETNTWTILDTTVGSDSLYAEISKSGVYCVMDIATLMDYVGVDVQKYYDDIVGETGISEEADTSSDVSLFGDISPSSGDTEVLLSNFTMVKLGQPLTPGSNFSSDNDSLSDIEELGSLIRINITNDLMKVLIHNKGLDNDDCRYYFETNGEVYLTVYDYESNPLLEDTDFDGIVDDYDNAPKDNYFAGKCKTGQATSYSGYGFDYRRFFESNTYFDQELAETSLMFSSFIYRKGGITFDEPVRYDNGSKTLNGTNDIGEILKIHDFEDVKVLDLAETPRNKDNVHAIALGYGDDDITEFAVGHREVTYNGETKDIVAVVVRGTNGTIEEWASNFDLGDPSESWPNKEHHRGFDVTTDRVYQYLAFYADDYLGDNSTYWVMGHSRGAAIANILSARLIDDGNEVFGYTFAAPNTTIATDAGDAKYNSIFNLVNEDDFVPTVPMNDWNFVRYGRTATVDMDGFMEWEWESFVGKEEYIQLSKKGLDDLVSGLANVSVGSASERWANCYTYTCGDHGDGSYNDIVENGINSIDVIPHRVLQYCEYEPYLNALKDVEYRLCQLPAYFMQALADLMVTKDKLEQGWKVFSTYQFADRYEDVRTMVISSAVCGVPTLGEFGAVEENGMGNAIEHPHFCETYNILLRHVSPYDFGCTEADRNNGNKPPVEDDPEAELGEIIDSGQCGDDVYWKLDDQGTLLIYGSGDMWDGGSYDMPWYESINSVTKVMIGNGVTSIGTFAFSFSESLTGIIIPNSVTIIGEGAFNYCSGLTSIEIPTSTIEIGDHAFYQCESLTSIMIPYNVASIGYSVFSNCFSLTSITVDSGNQKYSSENGVLFDKNKTTLIRYPEGKTGTNYSIPNGVTSIENLAFCNCDNLTSITIPNSVTSIGDYSFYDCDNLTSITIPNSVTIIGEDAFHYCSGLPNIEIPNSVTSIGYGAFTGCFSLTSITVDSGNQNYSSENGVLFDKNKTILICYPAGKTGTSYSIPNSVTSIGDEAFDDCDDLTSITIPNSVTSIGDYSFYDCDNLTSITIPSSVTSIGHYAFWWCDRIGFTIFGVPGSYAETYAKENDIPFSSIN